MRRGGNVERSVIAEQRFRELLAQLGGALVEPVWLGTQRPHRVICAAGHERSVYPSNAFRRGVICSTCTPSPSIAAYHQRRAEGAWRDFRDAVSRLGGVVIEPEWLGSGRPHRVICSAGHAVSQSPNNLQCGNGLCYTCSGLDPADAWRRFCERVAELGGAVVEPQWLGKDRPHHVVCAAGHDCHPWGGAVLRGQGLCVICRRSSSNAFYVVENGALDVIKLGITTGAGSVRLREHRYDGFTAVLRFLPGLDDAAFLEAHTLRTLKAAGVEPVRGREYFPRSALPVVLDLVDNWI